MPAAMILGAGLGTRLRPLTEWLAKPMVPVGDRPAVGHVAACLRAGGFERLVLNVHHRPDGLRAWASAEDVAISDEPELLGTAGGLSHAAAYLGAGDVLVWNGDILSDLDPRALHTAHERAEAFATLAVTPSPVGRGTVGIGEGGRVVRLRKESFGPEIAGGEFVGIQVVGADLRARLPARGCLVGDVYLPVLRDGGQLSAHVVSTSFIDIGTIAAYVEANRRWLERVGASWASPDAHVAASIEGSIIGAGARIDADAIRSIVWPGAHVRSRVEGAVVTPFGTVQS